MANSRVKGITVEINGSTVGLEKSLEGVNKTIRNTQSQLKDVEKLLKLDPTNTELLRQKQTLLKDAISQTSDKLESLKQANTEAAKTAGNYDAWKEKYDPIQKEIDETATKLNEMKEGAKEAEKQLAEGKISQEKFDEIQQSIGDTEKKLESLKKEREAVNTEFGKPLSPEQMDAIQREIIETEQELQRLQTEAAKSKTAFDELGEAGEKLQKLSDKVGEVGDKLTTYVTGPIVALGGVAVKTTADFDESMSKVKAISGATGEQFDDLRDKAREMGATTQFSASEAADAMTYMAMAGWKTEDMLGGVEGIMNLAAASGEELATTSDIVTDALTAFGKSADDAGKLADIMAAASSNANTNVSMLGESFKYVGATAGAMGFSMEDTNIALGLMANAGIKGSAAGNSLKNAMVNLTKPTKQQAEAMKALGWISTETIKQIDFDKVEKAEDKVKKATNAVENAQISLNSAIQKYGANSAQAKKASNNLENAQISLKKAQADLEKQQEGVSKSIEKGNVLMTNSDGSMKGLKEIMDGMRGSLGHLGVALTDADGNARDFDDIIKDLSKSEEGLTQAQQLQYAATIFGKQNMAGMLSILNASEEDYNKLTDAVYNCDGAAKSMADTMMDNLNGQLKLLKSALEELAISVGDVLMPTIRKIVEKVQQFVDWLNSLDEGTKRTIIKIALLVAAIGPALKVFSLITGAVGGFLTKLSNLPALITKVKGIIAGVFGGISAPVVAAVAAIGVLVAAFVHLWKTNEGFRNRMTEIWKKLKRVISNFVTNVKKEFDKMKQAAQPLIDWLKGAWDSLCQALAPVFVNAFMTISNTINLASRVIKRVIRAITALMNGDFIGAFNSIADIFPQIWEFICVTFRNAKATIIKVADAILGWFGTDWNTVWEGIKTFTSGIWGSITGFFTGAWDKIKAVWETVSGFFNGIWEALHSNPVLATITDFIFAPFKAAWDSIKGIWDGVTGFFDGLWATIKEAFTMSSPAETIDYLWTCAYTSIRNLWLDITGFFSGLWESITSGEALQNIVSGISGFFQNAYNAIAGEDGIWPKITGFFSGIWESITTAEGLAGILDALKKPFVDAWNAFAGEDGVWAKATEWFSGIWTNITENETLAGIIDVLKKPFEGAYNFIAGEDGIWTKATGFFSGIWENITNNEFLSGLLEVITKPFVDAYNAIKEVWETVTGFFSGIFGGVKDDENLAGVEGAIKNPFDGAWTFVSNTFSGIAGTISGWFEGIDITDKVKAVSDWVNGAWTTVTGAFENVGSKITGWFDGIDIGEKISKVSDWAEGAWGTITEWFGNAKSNIEGFFSGIDISDQVSAISSWAAGAWQSIKDAFNADGGVKEWFTTTFEGVGDAIRGAVDDIGQWATDTWEGVKGAAKNVGGWFASLFGWGTDDDEASKELETNSDTAGASAKQALLNAFAGADTDVAAVFESMLTLVGTSINGIVTAAEEAWKKILENTTKKGEEIKASISKALDSIDSNVNTKMKSVGDAVKTGLESTKKAFQDTLYSIGMSVDSTMNRAVKKVQEAVDSMRNSMNFTWNLPYLKLPHIYINGSWGFNPPSVPSFSVQWFKDAMENGFILNNPTIFGMMNGKLLGGGDAGSEAVVGTQSLMDMIRNAVSGMANMQTINYGGVNINVYGAPGQDIKALADEIEERINLNTMRRKAGFR